MAKWFFTTGSCVSLLGVLSLLMLAPKVVPIESITCTKYMVIIGNYCDDPYSNTLCDNTCINERGKYFGLCETQESLLAAFGKDMEIVPDDDSIGIAIEDQLASLSLNPSGELEDQLASLSLNPSGELEDRTYQLGHQTYQLDDETDESDDETDDYGNYESAEVFGDPNPTFWDEVQRSTTANTVPVVDPECYCCIRKLPEQ